MGNSIYQPYAFLACVLCGILLAVIYSILNCVRACLKRHSVACAILDILFWALALTGFALCLVVSTGGVLRVFPFLGLMLGFAACLVGFGRPLSKAFYRLAWKCKKWMDKRREKRKRALEKKQEND